MEKAKLFLIITGIIFLFGCSSYKPQVTPAPADTELRTFQACSAVTQDKDGNIIGMDLADVINYKSWVTSFQVIKELDEDIRNNWDYRIMFCDVPMDTLVVQDGVYYIPSTAEIHYVYLNKEMKVIQYDSKAYAMYEVALDDSIAVLERIIYR